MPRVLPAYLAVSGVCWVLHNVTVIAADRMGAPLALSIMMSFVVTVPLGYAMHSTLSFRSPFAFAAFARYVVAMSANIPLAFATLWLWRDLTGWRVEIAAPLATISTTLVNFALCRFAVFRRRDGSWVHP